MTGADTAIVNALGLVIKFKLNGVDLESLDERLIGGCGWCLKRVVFKLEEACDEVEGVLVDVEAKWKNRDLLIVSIQKGV